MLPPDQFLRFERLLQRVRYKPNFRFQVRAEYSDLLVIMKVPPAPLAPDGRREIQVISRILLGQCEFDMDDETFLCVCLRGGIQMAELHEVDEWLLFNGKHLVDPHGPVETIPLPYYRSDLKFKGLDRR